MKTEINKQQTNKQTRGQSLVGHHLTEPLWTDFVLLPQ